MANQTSLDQEKIDEYLRVIQERILAPIEVTGVLQYCTATLLLLFSAIDGLGKLLHSDDEAKPGERIRAFLEYMGGDYNVYKEELALLRNFLVHNAINAESFLSQTEIGNKYHLKKIGAAGFIYVNTMVMYRDFVGAFARFRSDIQSNPELRKRAANRLEWREDNPPDDLDPNVPAPSPPPPVEFIYAR
jgi:hypothetical protein